MHSKSLVHLSHQSSSSAGNPGTETDKDLKGRESLREPQKADQVNSADEVQGHEVALPKTKAKKKFNYTSSTGINCPEKILKLFQIKPLYWLGGV